MRIQQDQKMSSFQRNQMALQCLWECAELQTKMDENSCKWPIVKMGKFFISVQQLWGKHAFFLVILPTVEDKNIWYYLLPSFGRVDLVTVPVRKTLFCKLWSDTFFEYTEYTYLYNTQTHTYTQVQRNTWERLFPGKGNISFLNLRNPPLACLHQQDGRLDRTGWRVKCRDKVCGYFFM